MDDTKRMVGVSDPFVSAASTMPDSVMNENKWVRLKPGGASLMEGGIKEILLVFIRRAGF